MDNEGKIVEKLTVDLGENRYEVRVGEGLLDDAGKYLNLDRRVLVVTDDGVPAEYAERLARQCRAPEIVTLPQGEGSKSLDGLSRLLHAMKEKNFTRKDCVCAVGGGVVGDLSGFAAASYMRGVDFYNLPTTVLSCVDSSVGGKTGINFDGIKNLVGAFKQPKAVLADVGTLSTLPPRQVANGLAEAVKMALTFDEAFFSLFEKGNPEENLPEILCRSIACKIKVVEQDEKEQGLRRVLNFGHTLGHGIESLGLGLYHGECVALGMLPMCSEEVGERLRAVLKRLKLPTSLSFDREAALEAVLHDKKSVGGAVAAVFVESVGSFEIREIGEDELRKRLLSIEG